VRPLTGKSVVRAGPSRTVAFITARRSTRFSLSTSPGHFLSSPPSFMSPVPIVTATSAPSGSVPAAADISLNTASSSSPAGCAAAVLLHFLVVIGSIMTWDKIKRHQGKEKRRRWSETVDKCMQTGKMSAAGAQAAIWPSTLDPPAWYRSAQKRRLC